MKDKIEKSLYYLNDLDKKLGPIGGHHENVSLHKKGELSYESYCTEDGISHVLIHILDNIKMEHKFVLDIGAYSSHGSNALPVILKHRLPESQYLLIDGENKWQDRSVVKSWIDKDNIASVLEKHGCHKKMDLLSLDIDNMDYWVLRKLMEKKYDANIIALEFNPIFDHDESYVKKYKADARKNDKQTMGTSNYGASLRAFCELLEEYDYRLVYTITNNAIFIHKRFDTLNQFAILDENMIKFHSKSWVEPHKVKNNFRILGTKNLEQLKSIIIENFINLKEG